MEGWIPFGKIFFSDLLDFFSNVGLLILSRDWEGIGCYKGGVGGASRFVVLKFLAEA